MAKKTEAKIDSTTSVNSFDKLSALVREKWPEYVIEIVVIIFSITISLAVDEWKDSRQKQELEQIYLRGLYSDLKTDTSQIHEIIDETRQVIQKTVQLSETKADIPVSAYGPFLDNVRFVFKRPRFISENATFSDLKSTGNFQVISNFNLKSSLFDYYKQYEAIVQVESAELEATNSMVGPYILKRLPLANRDTKNMPAGVGTVVNEIEFQNAMLVRRSTREELLRDYEQSLKLARKILVTIQPQLK
jgi:hypothetical protein